MPPEQLTHVERLKRTAFALESIVHLRGDIFTDSGQRVKVLKDAEWLREFADSLTGAKHFVKEDV